MKKVDDILHLVKKVLRDVIEWGLRSSAIEGDGVVVKAYRVKEVVRIDVKEVEGE